QFENNLYNDWITKCRYYGMFDDIRVTLAAIPPQHLGYFNRPIPQQGDTDGDGLTDFQEALIFKSNPALLDTDADGQNDWDESMAGTDLRNPRSFFGLWVEAHPGDSRPIFCWHTTAGRRYDLETCPSLNESPWTAVPGYEQLNGDGSTMQYTHAGTGVDGAAYRLRVVNP
ncbi:MAG: hypothetical protein V2A34_05805, partial [Lentisphaerota bacterium]